MGVDEHLIVIDTEEGIRQLTETFKDAEFIAYDTETTDTTYDAQVIGFSVAADVSIGYYVILKYWDVDQQKLIDLGLMEAAKAFIRTLVGKSLVMQNAGFDCEKTNYNFGVELMPNVHTDVMLLAHLLDENRSVGLKQLATAIYGENEAVEQAEMKASVHKNGGVLTKKVYELYKADKDLIARYGAKDAILTLKLFYHLVPQLFEEGLDKFFYEEETMLLLRGPTYDMNTTGLRVDADRLQKLKLTLQGDIAEARAFIHAEIAAHIKDEYPGTSKAKIFNIASTDMLSWLLFEKLQNEFNTLTESGRDVCNILGVKKPYNASDKREFIYACTPRVGEVYVPATVNEETGKRTNAKKIRNPWTYMSCGKETIAKFAQKYKWCAKLLELKKNEKLLSTYVEGIQGKMRYNVIRPQFLQHGTTSGRYSSKSPNFQNLPRDDKRVKACIVPRPGNVFVGGDESQLEPRVFASQSGDERLQTSFASDDDFYSVAGIETFEKFDCVPKKDGAINAFGVKYPALRQVSKVVVLASTYGANGYQLAPKTGKTSRETQEIIDLYFEKFPKVKEFQLRCHKQAMTEGKVYSLFGRPRRIPDAKMIPELFGDTEHSELPYEWRNILNLAVNHPVQSTGASIVNRSAIAAWHKCRELEAIDPAWAKVKQILQVHDSLVLEGPEHLAESMADVLKWAMETTVELPGVKLEAIPMIGYSLAEV